MSEKASSSGADARTVLLISGMTCAGCASSVTRVLSRVPGVARATVDLATGRATVAGGACTADLIRAVQAAGYGAQPIA
jgi:copper chaperone CopZ